MVTQKRRRVRPKTATKKPPPRRRNPVKPATDWKGVLLKSAIGVIIVINGILLFFFIRQCSVPKEPPPVTEEAWTGPIQIEVLNGCNIPKIASKWTDYLRFKGFDVVRTDNYDSVNIQQTVIIDRRGRIENALQVAEAMGLSETHVLQEINDTYLLDVSVILGRDHNQLNGWRIMESMNGQ